MGPKPEPLTVLQAAFVREYLKDWNGTKAYQRAQASLGKKSDEYHAACAAASRLLAVGKVRSKIDQEREARTVNADDMRQRIIQELVALAFSGAEGLARWVVESCGKCWEMNSPQWPEGKPYPTAINRLCLYCRGRGVGHVHMTPTDELDPATLRLYDGMKVTATGVEVRVRSRDHAIALLAKHYGIGPERLELTGKDGGPVEVVGARDRLAMLLAKRGAPAKP